MKIQCYYGLLIYFIGFILTLLFLIKFPKIHKLDTYDCDRERTWSDGDDYSSNASAYISWSFAWILFVLISLAIYTMQKLTNKIKKYTK